MTRLHYSLWSIWGQLPLLPKSFLFVLVLVAAYTALSASTILLRLRSLGKEGRIVNETLREHRLAALEVRATNVRQLLTATFYLFGCVFFLAWPLAMITTDDSHIPVGILILNNFIIYFAFAANIFFIFLVLHCVQWFVSGHIRAIAARVGNESGK